MTQQHTTLPNSSVKFIKITVARLHPLLRIVKVSSRKLKIKYLSINPEEETLVSFDVSALFTSIPVLVALQVINSKISTCISFTNVCKIPTEKFIKLLEFTITNCIFYYNEKFYKQLQGAAMRLPVSPVMANIYIKHYESLAIPTSPTLIKWSFRYADDVHSATRKDQVNKLQEHPNSIDPHITFTIELPGTDGLPFLDTLTDPLLTLLNPQSTEKPPTQIGTYTTTLIIPFQQNYLLSTPSSTKLNKYILHLNSLQKKWIIFTMSYKTATALHSSFQQGKSQKKTNGKPNPSTGKFIEGASIAIPYIKGLSEQYRHTLAKHKVRVFFKGTSTNKSLLMHPKDPNSRFSEN